MIYVGRYNISHDRQKYGSRIVQRDFVQTAKYRQVNDVVTIISMNDVLNVVSEGLADVLLPCEPPMSYIVPQKEGAFLVIGNSITVFLVLMAMVIALGGSLYVRTLLTRRLFSKS